MRPRIVLRIVLRARDTRVEPEGERISPPGRKMLAHGVSHGNRGKESAPERGERGILPYGMRHGASSFAPFRGWTL